MNEQRTKQIIIANIQKYEFKDRIRILMDLVKMFKSEMLIFGRSK